MKILSMKIISCNIRSYILGTSSPSPLTATFAPAKTGEDNINRKSNIHRARLSKFKKSKLNGEMIFQDDEQRIYKFNDGKKVYL